KNYLKLTQEASQSLRGFLGYDDKVHSPWIPNSSPWFWFPNSRLGTFPGALTKGLRPQTGVWEPG
ncbi:MAG: hypothetical protein ACLFQM_08640, partial [Fidelibacterota bacterium]